jgi:hypothetical protein
MRIFAWIFAWVFVSALIAPFIGMCLRRGGETCSGECEVQINQECTCCGPNIISVLCPVHSARSQSDAAVVPQKGVDRE